MNLRILDDLVKGDHKFFITLKVTLTSHNILDVLICCCSPRSKF